MTRVARRTGTGAPAAAPDTDPDPDRTPDPVGRTTIGIDIGGTSVRAGVVDADGAVLDQARAATPSTVAATEDVIVDLVGRLAPRFRGTAPVGAVGLAVAGFLDRDRTTVLFAPHLAWRAAPVPEVIARRVGVPVVMDHDVNAAAWAEYRSGALAGARVGLLIALGTGIGAGLVVDGTIYRGAHGVAPELGHLTVVPDGRPCACGKRGCWERYCSGTALATTAGELWAQQDAPVLRSLVPEGPDGLTGSLVALAAAQGDPVAVAAMADLAGWLARGLALVADVLDPDVVAIGGGVSRSAEAFLPDAVAGFGSMVTGSAHRALPEVRVARFGGGAGLLGAAWLAEQSLHEPPGRAVAGAGNGRAGTTGR
ncbi:ROK family protein [Nakamurella leprariae]|uniref:ROK family protein n=1 Tax=Nakamurella leprariae TaxID=2803911 RepID=A0A938YFL3_9ACTN|nr:ROK family protein [Nakamurella leprariae]MBM9466925.1 ROK family protein [Nakamurella leprariae]